MLRYQVTEGQLKEKLSNDAMLKLIQQQISYAREKMLFGKPLGRIVRGRFGFQLRIMINGGLRVLELLEQQQNDLFSRPRLGKSDWLRMIWRSL